MNTTPAEHTAQTQVGQVGDFFPDGQPILGVEAAGDMIGPYKLVQILGTGGMGSVWQAEQEQPVRRTVAIKLIKAGMDTAQVIARFTAERQALALMDHPNIAKVLDAGMIGGTATNAGRPYFVMELVRGVPITNYCDENRLSPRERLELFIPVCQAVQHAHQKGIIHRDLKPTNVLIGLYDGKPIPKVIDFGVAKATAGGNNNDTPFTQIGALIGTPIYMAPEQADAHNFDIDTRADIYALGVIIYELLTGGTPFTREQFQRVTVIDMIRLIRDAEPPKPSTRLSSSDNLLELAAQRRLDPKKLTSSVAGDLDWIVMKCLEKDRNRRYETANGLALDIQRYLHDEPVLAGPPSAGYRIRKFVHRNRGSVIAAGLIVLALIGAVVGTTWGLVKADRALKVAEAARKVAETERQTAEAVQTFLQSDLLQQASPWEQADALVKSGRSAEEAHANPTMKEVLDRSAEGLVPEKINLKFPDQPLVQARILQTVGNTYRGIGEYDKAIDHLSRCRDLLKDNLNADDPKSLSILDDLAQAYLAAGKVGDAIGLFKQVRDLSIVVHGPDNEKTLSTRNNLALAMKEAKNLADAIHQFEELYEHEKKVLGTEHQETLITLNNLALTYREAGQIKKAIELFKQAQEQLTKKFGAAHPWLLQVKNNLAGTFIDDNRHADAVPLLEQVRDQQIKKQGEDQPETLATKHNLAVAFLGSNRAKEAVELLENVCDKRVKVLGPNHPRTFASMIVLAQAYEQVGELPKAIPIYEKVRQEQEVKYGLDHPETLRTINTLAIAYRNAGRIAAAVAAFEDVLKRRQASPNANPVEVARTMIGLAASYRIAKEHTRQEQLLRKALEILDKVMPGAWIPGMVRSLIGEALLDQDKPAEAEPLLIQGYENMKQLMDQNPRSVPKEYIVEAVDRLVRLNETTRKPDQIAKWKQERSQLVPVQKQP